MHCRPLHLFGAIGRERANDQSSVRLYRSRGKHGDGEGGCKRNSSIYASGTGGS